MPTRYLNYNTHVIDPEINTQQSIEFLELGDKNVIKKIPYKDQVDVFYKDDEGNVLHGTFILGGNEFYEGSAKVITYQEYNDVENIFIESSFYRPTDYFYFFSEEEGNVYLRVYKRSQGSFNERILVKEKSTIKTINRAKENFILIVEDAAEVELLEKVNSNLNGELKMVFVFENDITRFENDETKDLDIQEFDVPFNDIPEKLYSIENQVENGKGSLYLRSPSQIELKESAVNGSMVRSSMVTEMEHDQRFSIIYRHKPYLEQAAPRMLLKTTSMELSFHYDKIVLSLSDGHEYAFTKTQVDGFGVSHSFHTLIFSYDRIGNKHIFTLFDARDDLEENDYTIETYVYENAEFFIDEKILEIGSNYGVDYLAIKNRPLTKKLMLDLTQCFKGDIYKNSQPIEDSISGIDVEKERNLKIENLKTLAVHVIPEDAIVPLNNFVVVDDGKTYHITSGVSITVDENVTQADFFIEDGGRVINANIDSGHVYMKNGSFMDFNGKSLTVYHETAATLSNAKAINAIEMLTLFFEDMPEITSTQIRTDIKYNPSVDAIFLAPTPPDHNPLFGNFLSPLNDQISLAANNEFGYNTYTEGISGVCTKSFLPVNRFIDDGDGTIIDVEQNLIFTKKPFYVNQHGGSIEPIDGVVELYPKYESANFQIENTQIGNYTDWRLPTSDELDGISSYISANIDGFKSFENITSESSPALSECGCVSGTNLGIATTATLASFDFSSDIFDFSEYNNIDIDSLGNFKTDLVWTEAPDASGNGKVYSFYSKQEFTNNVLNGCPANLGFAVRRFVPNIGLNLVFDDGEKYFLPQIAGEDFYLNKRGNFHFEKTHKNFDFYEYIFAYSNRVFFTDTEGIDYYNHEDTNSSNTYFFGTEIPLNRKSSAKESDGTVFPMRLLERFNIHKYLFAAPEKNIRICENLRQKTDFVPFKIETDTLAKNILLWTTLDRFQDKIGYQYGLVEEKILNNIAEEYSVFNRNVYSQDEYYSAFHFDKIVKQNQKLINEITIDDNGELILIGKTDKSTYIREIKKIRFMDTPQRYKSSSVILEVDVEDIKNTQSYINNYEDIRTFLFKIIEQWKPSHVILEDLIEKETLVMARLLQDEYTQVLIGLTPLDNFNAYYNRTVDSREVAVKSSSDVGVDKINWIGIPQLNTPYLKSGVTKVINEKKNIKVSFDTRFSNDTYRIFVFCPYNAKFYAPIKDRDGFIVESSSTVRDEVSWIALNTTEVRNGTVSWKSGVPNGDIITNHFDRITEISKHSNTYTLNFTDFGFEQMDDSDYSVILSTNKNVNVWVDGKSSKSFTIRRSYVGDDLEIDWFLVRGTTKWWQGVTS